MAKQLSEFEAAVHLLPQDLDHRRVALVEDRRDDLAAVVDVDKAWRTSTFPSIKPKSREIDRATPSACKHQAAHGRPHPIAMRTGTTRRIKPKSRETSRLFFGACLKKNMNRIGHKRRVARTNQASDKHEDQEGKGARRVWGGMEQADTPDGHNQAQAKNTSGAKLDGPWRGRGDRVCLKTQPCIGHDIGLQAPISIR